MGKREFDVLGKELLDVRTADRVCAVDFNDLEDVNRAETGTVTSSHVLVEGLNGLSPAHLAELLVHVVGAGARVVAEPDTEVLDLERALLIDHVQADDLAIGLLDLPELSKEVPEPRLGHNGVGREDAHAVQLGRGVGLGGQVTPDNLVLVETPYFIQSAAIRIALSVILRLNHFVRRLTRCDRRRMGTRKSDRPPIPQHSQSVIQIFHSR